MSNVAITIPDNVLLQRLADGESVMLHLEDETYFGLNEVGTRMIDILSTSGTLDEAVEALSNEYEVDPATLRRDLEDLLESLEARGLVSLA